MVASEAAAAQRSAVSAGMADSEGVEALATTLGAAVSSAVTAAAAAMAAAVRASAAQFSATVEHVKIHNSTFYGNSATPRPGEHSL